MRLFDKKRNKIKKWSAISTLCLLLWGCQSDKSDNDQLKLAAIDEGNRITALAQKALGELPRS